METAAEYLKNNYPDFSRYTEDELDAEVHKGWKNSPQDVCPRLFFAAWPSEPNGFGGETDPDALEVVVLTDHACAIRTTNEAQDGDWEICSKDAVYQEYKDLCDACDAGFESHEEMVEKGGVIGDLTRLTLRRRA
jgi:hypothetical protein